MSLRDRMGFDAAGMRLEDALEWATHNLGDREVHLNPGQGNIDFAALFQRLELSGYRHHYMMAFGSRADKLAGRDYFTACWPEA